MSAPVSPTLGSQTNWVGAGPLGADEHSGELTGHFAAVGPRDDVVDGWIGRHDAGVKLQACEGAKIVAEVRELLDASGRASMMVAPTSKGLYAFPVGHYHSSADGSVVERHDLELRAGDEITYGAREIIGLISQDVVIKGAAKLA